MLEIDEDIADVLQCVWVRVDYHVSSPSFVSYALCSTQKVSSPTTVDSDPFVSQTSITSISDVAELPEIPFVVPSPLLDDEDIDDSASSIWLRRRPAISATSSERQIAILGQASERVFGHCRQRSGSITSTASRPAPAKSILSSSSSIRTRTGRSAPSVKFLDMPTIHYEDEDEEDIAAEDTGAETEDLGADISLADLQDHQLDQLFEDEWDEEEGLEGGSGDPVDGEESQPQPRPESSEDSDDEDLYYDDPYGSTRCNSLVHCD